MKHAITITLAAALSAALFADLSRAQTVGAQTYSDGLDPADVDSFRVVTGFAQSFELTVSGTLASIEIQADWKPGSTATTYGWRLWRDIPNGTPVDSGSFDITPSTTPGSGAWSIPMTTSIAVAEGDVLVFMLRQLTSSTVGQAELDWWAGDVGAFDSYVSSPVAHSTGFVRSGADDSYAAGEDHELFQAAFDLRLRAWVVEPNPDTCVPESDVCAVGAGGTVFYIDLVGPGGEVCFVRCESDANGQSLTCASAVCEP